MHQSKGCLNTETRARLILAAREAFIDEGFHVTVDNIAARAGVAEQTLYNYFPSKEELFVEVIGQGAEAMLASLDGAYGSLRESLICFATSFRRRVLAKDNMALLRILTAEISHLPELSKAFFTKGASKTHAHLSEFLASAMDDGHLRRDCPKFASDMLIGMLFNTDFIHCQCVNTFRKKDESMRCEKIIDCFLHSFSPNRNS